MAWAIQIEFDKWISWDIWLAPFSHADSLVPKFKANKAQIIIVLCVFIFMKYKWGIEKDEDYYDYCIGFILIITITNYILVSINWWWVGEGWVNFFISLILCIFVLFQSQIN